MQPFMRYILGIMLFVMGATHGIKKKYKRIKYEIAVPKFYFKKCNIEIRNFLEYNKWLSF